MEVKGDALQAALARAIMEVTPLEVQKEVFGEAIFKYLFQTDRDGKSVLTQAFQDALRDATRQIVHRFMQEPENESRIRAELSAQFEAFLASPLQKEKMIERFIGSFPRY